MPIIKVAQHKPENMTVLAFRNRFTMEEKIAIEEAITTVTLVRVFDKDLSNSKFIYRFDPQIIEGLQGLEAAGLIGEGRADEIQEAPVEDHERYVEGR